MMENNGPCEVTGIGKVEIKMFDRMIRILGLVRYVLVFNRIIISRITSDLKG